VEIRSAAKKRKRIGDSINPYRIPKVTASGLDYYSPYRIIIVLSKRNNIIYSIIYSSIFLI